MSTYFLNLRIDYIRPFSEFLSSFEFLVTVSFPFFYSIFISLSWSFWSSLNEAKSCSVFVLVKRQIEWITLGAIHIFLDNGYISFTSIAGEKVDINSSWINYQFLARIRLVQLCTPVAAIYPTEDFLFFSILNDKLYKFLQFSGHISYRNFW